MPNIRDNVSLAPFILILLEARNLHVSYLQALLLASDPGATDVRLKQIADFGGKETMELLGETIEGKQ